MISAFAVTAAPLNFLISESQPLDTLFLLIQFKIPYSHYVSQFEVNSVHANAPGAMEFYCFHTTINGNTTC